MVKGYTQKHGQDFNETFSHAVWHLSVRAQLAFAVQNVMIIHQMDVVTAFLHRTLDEEIYMEQPQGYVKKGEEHFVCKLNKSIYGLKQSPRCWNTVFKEHMESTNFKQCTADPCIFVRSKGTDLTIIALYIDDFIIVTKTLEKMRRIKNSVGTCLKMKDLGKLYSLGLLLSMTKRGSVCGCTKGSVFTLLEHYGLSQAKTSTTPADTNFKLVKDDGISKLVDPICYQSMLGSLLYDAIATRPDIA